MASARGSVMLPRGHSPCCARATDVSTALPGSAVLMDGGGPGAESQGEILQVYCLPIHPVFTPFCLPDSLPSSLSLQFLFALGTPTRQG